MIAQGTYTPEELGLDFESNNCTIFGESAGNTFIHGDIVIKGHRPEIQNVTIFGSLTIENGGEVFMSNVWVHPPAGKTGIKIWIRGNETGRQYWTKRGEEPEVQKRASCMTFNAVHVLGEGNGWYFLNGGGEGGFINHAYIYGGHTAVDGVAFSMVSMSNVCAFAHHVDASGNKGMVIDRNSKRIEWNNAFIEPNTNARDSELPVVIGLVDEFTTDVRMSMLAMTIGRQVHYSRADVEEMMGL